MHVKAGCTREPIGYPQLDVRSNNGKLTKGAHGNLKVSATAR